MLTQNERSKILHNAMQTWNKQKMKIYQKCKNLLAVAVRLTEDMDAERSVRCQRSSNWSADSTWVPLPARHYFFKERDKLVIKPTWKCKECRAVKTILRRNRRTSRFQDLLRSWARTRRRHKGGRTARQNSAEGTGRAVTHAVRRFLSKVPGDSNRKQKVLTIGPVGITDSHREENEPGSPLAPHPKTNVRSIKDLNVKSKPMMFLGENLTEEFQSLEVDRVFLGQDAKSRTHKKWNWLLWLCQNEKFLQI